MFPNLVSGFHSKLLPLARGTNASDAGPQPPLGVLTENNVTIVGERVRRVRRSTVCALLRGGTGTPGTYFRLLLIGYFEGIDSERGLAWRTADSLALRGFLELGALDRRSCTTRGAGRPLDFVQSLAQNPAAE
jgi:Transposase domain (DUF772)